MTMQNEQGRTMLEMLGVIAIIGIITYGAIAGINYGMTSYKINQTYNDVQDIISGVSDLYSWSKEYPNRSEMMEAIAANDIVSGEIHECTSGGSGNKCIMGQFGNITVEPTDSGASFQVNVSLSDGDICTRLASLDWKAANIHIENSQCEKTSAYILKFSPD